MYHAIKILN